MRRLVALVLATTAMLAASIAAADTEVPFAVAVNAPTSWVSGHAYAASGYVGVAKHHAVRFNVASYDYSSALPELVAALGSNSIETKYSGNLQDIAIGWQAYSRGLCDGFTFSVEALVRRTDTRRDEYWAERVRETQSTTLAGRVMVGWSWTIQQRAFISLQAGLSTGLERGHEDVTSGVYFEGDMETKTVALDRQVEAAEGFLRFGLMFGGN